MFILLVVLTNKLMDMETLNTYEMIQEMEEFFLNLGYCFEIRSLTQNEVKNEIEYDSNFKMLTCEMTEDSQFSVTPDESKFLNDKMYDKNWIAVSYGDCIILSCIELAGEKLKIAAMEVSEAYKGQGFGKIIVKAIENYAYSNGISAVSIRAFDSSAHSFWEHMGYEDMEDGSMVKYCGL